VPYTWSHFPPPSRMWAGCKGEGWPRSLRAWVSPLWPSLTYCLPHWVRMQRLLSGPWVPGSGVSGQVLAVAPDGKLLFSGGYWDGSLRVTALPRGKLLNQLNRHLGMSSLGTREETGRCGVWF
jgi:hypothetical protein